LNGCFDAYSPFTYAKDWAMEKNTENHILEIFSDFI